MMNRKKRLLSSLLCVIFVAALIVSGALIATRLQNECLGESCPVCAAISGWERLLRGMALAAALESALLLAQRALGVCLAARFNGTTAHTLVTLKVKLSD